MKCIILNFRINLIILLGKFHIHKSKYAKTFPNFKVLMIEFEKYIHSLECVFNKKISKKKTQTIYEQRFKMYLMYSGVLLAVVFLG